MDRVKEREKVNSVRVKEKAGESVFERDGEREDFEEKEREREGSTQ